MAETAEVIQLNERRKTFAPLQEKFQVEVRTYSGAESKSSARETDIDELYAADTPTAQLIGRARQLMAASASRLRIAQSLLSESDVVGADNEMSLLQADLPEMFCCRELSEGLGALTIAIFHSLKNRAGEPLNEDQLFALRGAFETMHANPFLPFHQAIELIESLVDAGLVTDPPEAEILSDFFVK